MAILIEILKEKKLGKRASLPRVASGSGSTNRGVEAPREKIPPGAVGMKQSTMVKAIRRSEASGASPMTRTAQAGPMRRRATCVLMCSR
jgi:hypothetical protein